MTSNSIRVAIFEPSPVVTHGLVKIFNAVPDIEIVLESSSKAELLNKYKYIGVDVVLLDLEEEGQSELKFLRETRDLRTDVKIIALLKCHHKSDTGIKNRLIEVFKLGVKGLQCKLDLTADEFIHAIRTVYAGGVSMPPCVASVLLGCEISEQSPSIPKLSNREQQVLEEISMGKSNSEIAGKLFISLSTVKCHVSSILTKLKVKNRTQATLWML